MDDLHIFKKFSKVSPKIIELVQTTDTSQYRLSFGSPLLYKSVFHLNRLTAQLSYEGRAAVEGGK
jgi:hypothetical protein